MPDARDLLLDAQPQPAQAADIRASMPGVYNQLAVGSCVGNGVAAVMEHAWIAAGQVDFAPSRLFIYYNARLVEACQGADCGAEIRDGLKSVVNFGACHETLWPYDTKKVCTVPTPAAYGDGLIHKALVYYRVQRDLTQIQGCLTDGFPVVFGMACYASFEGQEIASTGILPMPSLGESMKGAHCVVIVGYDNARSAVLIRNSWGQAWGLDGHFWMPYQYLLNRNLTSDFWTIRRAG